MEFLVVKIVLFIKMSIFLRKKSFYFELCIHAQNNIFWLRLFIIGKNSLEIIGLLLFNYLIILGLQKNTKGMDLWGCYHVPFLVFSFMQFTHLCLWITRYLCCQGQLFFMLVLFLHKQNLFNIPYLNMLVEISKGMK
jgi:hypothetical protein